MRIVIISGIAPPEPLTAGRINWDIANHLAAEGNEVWFISPKPSRPLGVKYPKIKGNNVSKKNDKLFHVNVDSFTYPEYNALCRAYESLDFGIKAIRYADRWIKDYDFIYVSSWPLFCPLMIMILRRNKKVPLVMNIQDLYPESFLLKIKSRAVSSLFRPLYFIDKVIARKAAHVTVISESFRQAYREKRKIPESKISVIQNWQDCDEFVRTSLPKEEILIRYNLTESKGKFIYMYLGNIGPVAGVDKILASFSKIENGTSFLIIAGSGTARDKCRLLAQKLRIANIVFIEVPPGLNHVAELQSISDVLLLPVSPDAANSSIPSKLIAYMLSGKPVITSADMASETALTVNAAGCGWITRSNEADEWADVMKTTLNTSRVILDEMGQSGFDYAIKNFSRSESLKKISLLISNVNSWQLATNSWQKAK